MSGALEAASANPTQRVLILRGAGRAFCAGLDLRETTVIEKAHRSAEMVAKTLLAIYNTVADATRSVAAITARGITTASRSPSTSRTRLNSAMVPGIRFSRWTRCH